MVNGKSYVGKTKCFWRRCHCYLNAYRKRNHRKINNHLMNAFDKHGLSVFIFTPIEFCDISLLADRELYWIDLLKTTDRSKGYNLRRDSSTGMVTHPSTSEKIRNNLRKQWESGVRDGHGLKMKEFHKDNFELKKRYSEIFTRLKTKYEYIINDVEVLSYKQLKDRGLSNVISTFHRKKVDTVAFKGFKIVRKKLEVQP
jgi:group I intron endonuclease